MFRGFCLQNGVWNLGIMCALLAWQHAAVADENDLFGEASNPEQASDDSFADTPTQESTGQDDEQEAEPFPANLKIVSGSGQRVVEGGVISSRGLITEPPAVREANDRIDAALDQPLKQPLAYIEIPLVQIMQAISDDYDIPIVFDRKGLADEAITEEVEVTVSLRNISLRSALEIMLSQASGLKYCIDNQVLVITSEREAERKLEVRVYQVDDLIRVPGTGELDFDSLIDTIVSVVELESWIENGTGPAEIYPYPPGMLVIAQNRQVHQQIEALLATMREVKQAIQANSHVANEEPSKAVCTRAFRIQNVWGDDPKEGREILTEAIARSVEWEREGVDEEDTFLAVMPDRVIVRHTLPILRQVHKLLVDLNYAKGGDRPTVFFSPSLPRETVKPGGGFFNVKDKPQKSCF